MTRNDQHPAPTPDGYFVIDGGQGEWNIWLPAMLTVLDVEHRLRGVNPNEFVAHIPSYDKDVWYRYLPVNQINKTRGILRWAVIPIGQYADAWTEENLAWLQEAIRLSMRAH